MPTFSRGLEQSLHRALALANERHHEYATLEHLLLALIEDQDATAVMRACNVDLQKLRRRLVAYLESELDNLVTDGADDSKQLCLGDHRALPQRRTEICRWADLGALALDDALRSQQTAADRIRAARIDDLPCQRPAAALAKRFDRHPAVPYSVAAVGARGVSRDRGLAPPERQVPSARRIQSGVEAFLHVGASIAFSAGGLDDFHRLGRQAVAGADRHPGLAGYLASILDLPGAHGLSSVRGCTKTAAGRRDACAGDSVNRPYCVGLCRGRLSDLFSHLYASRRGPCSRRSGTLFRYRSPGRCGICRRHDQPRAAKWHALGHCDRRLIALRNGDRRGTVPGTLVNLAIG